MEGVSTLLPGIKKRDSRPAKGGWCPGSYQCSCASCDAKFIGDKRCHTCADCAYDPNPKPPQYVHHVCAWMIERFSRAWSFTSTQK